VDGTAIQTFDFGVNNVSKLNTTTTLSAEMGKVRVTYKLKHLHE